MRYNFSTLQDKIYVLVSAVEGSGGGQTLAALLVLVHRLFYRRATREQRQRLLPDSTSEKRVGQSTRQAVSRLESLLRH